MGQDWKTRPIVVSHTWSVASRCTRPLLVRHVKLFHDYLGTRLKVFRDGYWRSSTCSVVLVKVEVKIGPHLFEGLWSSSFTFCWALSAGGVYLSFTAVGLLFLFAWAYVLLRSKGVSPFSLRERCCRFSSIVHPSCLLERSWVSSEYKGTVLFGFADVFAYVFHYLFKAVDYFSLFG